MSETRYTVAIVVDPDFGERLRAVVARLPAWIVYTEANRRIAEQIWAEGGATDHTQPGGLTTIRVDPTKSREEWCAGILWSVAGHHDAYSHNPGYSAIEVFGAEPTPALTQALAEYKLTELRPFPGGFTASTVGGVLADSPNYPLLPCTDDGGNERPPGPSPGHQ
ncbi:MAG TPA: hypothetical protein VH539_18180 [Gemmatimonadaceae bacterium]